MFEKETAATVYLKDYQPPEYTIDTVDLIFYLYEHGSRVRSRLTVRRVAEQQGTTKALKLMGEGLEPIWVRLDGSELSASQYRVDEQYLTIFEPPDNFVLETEVEIQPQNNTSLTGLYRSGSMFCTQCEAEGFRRITWFLDRPDVMADFRTKIEADKQKYPVLLGNGNLVESGDLPNGRHYVVWQDPFPKPCYLFALVAADLKYIEDWHTTPSGRDVQLRIYVEPENIAKCQHAMRSLKNAMVWDEQCYGRECDLDVYNIVAVNDFNMGAMENKGLNIFNSKLVLASPDTATDRDYQRIESVIGHEYFHNWTGNRITCRDWFQLSLKEGFTVYRDQEFSADMGSRGVKRIEDVRLLREHQFPEDAGPMAHSVRPDSYIEINNFYTSTVYEKGAEVVRMQANLLGTEAFRNATDLYFERFDGQAVTTDDFVQCMEDVSGKDLTQFKNWYDFAGTPEVKVESQYDPGTATYRLRIGQQVPDTPGQTAKPPFHIPFAMGLLDRNGTDLPLISDGVQLHRRILEVTESVQEFEFEQVSEEPIPSLLRGFSAPIKVKYDYADEELMFLAANDSDGFARWDASQLLSQRILLRLVEAQKQGVRMEVPDAYVDMFRSTLQDESDPSLIAEILNLPGEQYIGEQMETVDVEAIYLARQQVRITLATETEQALYDRYHQLHERLDYQVTPGSIGRRRLKSLILYFLMGSQTEKANQLCLAQYQEGSNMTDVLSALDLIVDSEHPDRADVLHDFAERWRQEPLVMDKWFAVQAHSHRTDTLENLVKLLEHDCFSIKNPNKVYSLIGTFAFGNPLRFHAADGSGYEFLTERVLQLDTLNPQVAARILRSLARWHHFDVERQEKMRHQLERILSVPGISRDVFEVANKSLKQ